MAFPGHVSTGYSISIVEPGIGTRNVVAFIGVYRVCILSYWIIQQTAYYDYDYVKSPKLPMTEHGEHTLTNMNHIWQETRPASLQRNPYAVGSLRGKRKSSGSNPCPAMIAWSKIGLLQWERHDIVSWCHESKHVNPVQWNYCKLHRKMHMVTWSHDIGKINIISSLMLYDSFDSLILWWNTVVDFETPRWINKH